MKSVLISIRPKWCELIASGEKTIEVRKTRPKMGTPFKCYIYCTKGDTYKLDGHHTNACREKIWIGKPLNNLSVGRYVGNSKVIGEFVCDCITGLRADNGIQTYYNGQKGTCLSDAEIIKYAGGKKIYYWHISDLKVYDKPRELSEFAVADKEAIQQCEYREQSYYAFTDTGYIKNGFYCKKKDDWCFGECKRKALTRPPQSYMFVEEV